jgi:hypothetical protein
LLISYHICGKIYQQTVYFQKIVRNHAPDGEIPIPPILLAEKDQHLIVIALVISKYARLPYIWRRPFGCGKARDMERAVLAEGRLARMEKQNALLSDSCFFTSCFVVRRWSGKSAVLSE